MALRKGERYQPFGNGAWTVRIRKSSWTTAGTLWDADPGGQYLLGVVLSGEKTGIYEVSISDRKCTLLLPGVVTSGVTFARDGKSFLYAVASRGEVTIYRQPWKDGKVIGTPQVALKIPFSFSADIRKVTPTIFPGTFPQSSMRVPAVTPTSIF